MFDAGNITGETEPHRKALAVINNVTALMGLLVLGFPVTTATISTTLASWVLVPVAIMGFLLTYLRPQACLAQLSTVHARIN